MDIPTILIIDDEPANIKLLYNIFDGKYRVRIATTGIEAIERVMISPKPDIILLDIMMPEMDGFDLCKKLKSQRYTANIPIIFVTAKTEEAEEAKGFELGAVDFVSKPISPTLILARVKIHLKLAERERDYESIIFQRTKELYKTQKAAISMLGEAGHFNDNDTGVHVWRMADYAKEIAQKLDWNVDQTKMLQLAAPLHDTGKIGIPDSILKAPRSLTEEEWTTMKTHTTIGYSILSKSNTPLFQMAADIALYHHEKWDGTGYPKGLKKEEIPLSARIVAVADVFDALTMKRPYKEAWPIAKAIREIKSLKEKHFDPAVVDAFSSVIEEVESIILTYNLQN